MEPSSTAQIADRIIQRAPNRLSAGNGTLRLGVDLPDFANEST